MPLIYIDKYGGGLKVFSDKGRVGTIFQTAADVYQFRKKGDAHLRIGPIFTSIADAKTWLEERYGDERNGND